MVLVRVAVRVDVLQQLYFVHALVEEVLVVLDHLKTHPLGLVGLRNQVGALQSGREGGLTQHVRHLIPARDHGALDRTEVLDLLEAGARGVEDDLEVEE